MNENKTYTWEELRAMPEGAVIKDWMIGDIRCLILRCYSSLCGYVGIKDTSKLAGLKYNEITLNVHWGLSFTGEGDGIMRPLGWYFFGWDYGHCDDYAFYYDTSPRMYDNPYFQNQKKWLVEDIIPHVESAAQELALLEKVENLIGKKKRKAK